MSGGRPLPAAVLSATDPRARDAARVVPADADLVQIGGATVGYLHRPKRGAVMSAWERRGRERRNELARLVEYRARNALSPGPAQGWAAVLVNLRWYLDGAANRDSVQDLAIGLGLPRLTETHLELALDSVPLMARGMRSAELLSAAAVGEAVGLTSVEREDLHIRNIDAVDEPAARREARKRLARAAKYRLKTCGATPRAHSKSTTRPWEPLGISRRTYYRKGLHLDGGTNE